MFGSESLISIWNTLKIGRETEEELEEVDLGGDAYGYANVITLSLNIFLVGNKKALLKSSLQLLVQKVDTLELVLFCPS